jgi:hypothetical protein
VAEGGGLLNRYRVKSSIGGSNPPLSAISHHPWLESRGIIGTTAPPAPHASVAVLLAEPALLRCMREILTRFGGLFFRGQFASMERSLQGLS